MSTEEQQSAPENAVVRPPESLTQSVQVARALWLRSLFGPTEMAQNSANKMDALASQMTEYFVPRGTPLYQAGSASNSLYFIVEGAIEQGTDGYHRFVSGDVLGFVDAMIDRPHQQTAQVVEDAVVLRLKLDDWLEFMEDDFSALQGIILASLKNVGVYPDQLTPEASEICRRLCSEREKVASADFVRTLLVARLNPLFRMAGMQAISQLIRGAKVIRLKSGEEWLDLWKNPGLCLVTAGRVQVEFPELESSAAETHDYETGQLVASIYGFSERPSPICLTAQASTELLQIDVESIFDIMEDHFDVGRSILSYLALRVELANANTRKAE